MNDALITDDVVRLVNVRSFTPRVADTSSANWKSICIGAVGTVSTR